MEKISKQTIIMMLDTAVLRHPEDFVAAQNDVVNKLSIPMKNHYRSLSKPESKKSYERQLSQLFASVAKTWNKDEDNIKKNRLISMQIFGRVLG